MLNALYSARDGSKGEQMPSQARAVGMLSFLETLLLVIALYYLGFADGGVAGWLKLLIFGLAAWLVSFLVNRLAVEHGVALASQGSKIAGPLSGVSVLLVGAAFLMATFTGLTTPKVEEMRLSGYLETFERYVDGRVVVADKTAELVPIMQSLAEDLNARSQQECANGGCGSIARALQALHGRANGLSTQMTASLGSRQDVLDRISALRKSMNTTLLDESFNIWTRRANLRRQHGQMLSLLAELKNAVPVSMVSTYARELQSGVLIPGRENASAQINQTLNGISISLTQVLEEQQEVAGNPPQFPSKTGSLDTFAYWDKFAPVLLLTFIIDMLFPILLWAYTMMVFRQAYPTAPKPLRPRSTYDIMTDRNAIDPSDLEQHREGTNNIPEPKPTSQQRPPHRANGKAKRGGRDV